MSDDTAEPVARVCGPDDVERVVEILAGAFFDDPTWAWLLPDPASRSAQLRRVWRHFVDGAMRYPGVWLNAGETATAVWIPPGGTEFSPEQEEQWEPLLFELGGSAAPRMLDALAAFDAAHPHDIDHYYLTLLGTDPSQRGRGLGLALLEDTLAVVDEDGMPAYLEASSAVNVPLYERYGFRALGTFALPGGGPDVTTMWRDPLRR